MLAHAPQVSGYERPTRRSPLPKRTGFSGARLARLQATLRRHVDGGRVPGLVALVHQCGREHVEAIGTMAFDSDVPMRRDTIFRLASTTKPITAVAAMTLVEECKLRLDDPTDEWLPELSDRRVLRTLGVDEVQGYLHARPMSGVDLSSWLRGRSARRVL